MSLPTTTVTPVVHAAQLISLTTSLLLSGINFGASHLTLPILHRLDAQKVSPAALATLYHHSARLVVPFAILSSIASVIVATQSVGGVRVQWIVASVTTLVTLPLARVTMRETSHTALTTKLGGDKSGNDGEDDDRDNASSKDLLLPDCEEEDSERQQVLRILKRWKRMNLVRSVLALVGGLTAAVAVVYRT